MISRAALVAAVALMVGTALAAPASAQHEHHMPLRITVMPAAHLQAMIDAAPTGALVSVSEARYVGTIVVDRPLTLQGVGRPVLDGDGAGSVLTITAADVTVRDLVIRGSGSGPVGSPSGVMIEGADRARIEHVRIERSYIGITVRGSAGVVIEHVRIAGPREGAIEGEIHAVASEGDADATEHDHAAPARLPGELLLRGDGIWLWNAVDAVVRGTWISDVRDGIYLSYGEGALLEENLIERSRYGVHDMYAKDLTIRDTTMRANLSGCVLMYGGPVLLERNTILESGSPSTGFAVLIKDAGGVTLRENVLADNRIGLHVDDAGRTGGEATWVEANTIAMNQVGALLYPSSDATFVRNSFVENSTQVTLGGDGRTQAVWSANGVGNHWSDYRGFDRGGDGIGDLPYTQGGRTSRLLAREPLLIALASGPAFRLLSAFDDRWSLAEPVVVDPDPLMSSTSPSLRGARSGGTVPLWLPGLAMLAASTWLLLRARRRPLGRTAVAHG